MQYVSIRNRRTLWFIHLEVRYCLVIAHVLLSTMAFYLRFLWNDKVKRFLELLRTGQARECFNFCGLTLLNSSNVLGLIVSRFCLLSTSLTSLFANILSMSLSAPSTRPPISTRFTDWPNISTVRSTDAERGIQDLPDQIRLLSTDPPAFAMVENPDSSMLRENFLWSRLNFFSRLNCSRMSRVSCFKGLDVSIRLVRCVQMKLPTCGATRNAQITQEVNSNSQSVPKFLVILKKKFCRGAWRKTFHWPQQACHSFKFCQTRQFPCYFAAFEKGAK